MKREAFHWLLTATAGARPLLEWEQGSTFDYPGLRFNYDKKFRITMFNDLHLGDHDRPYDDKTIGVMTSVLNNESGTDLVVLNGDLTSCEWVAPQDVNGLVDKIINPIINRKLPFAATFGNHDMSKTCDTRKVSDHMWKASNKNGAQLSWSQSSVFGDYNSVGTSNYYIPIYSSSGGGNPQLKMILWFFDSKGGRQYNGGNGPDVRVDDWVDEKVIAWFKLTRDQIRNDHGGKAIPSLVFVHIPPAVTLAFQKNGGRTETTEPGLNEEEIGHQGDSNAGADIPFMQALVETEGLIAVFSGHDHGIDWCMKWSATKPIPSNTPAAGNNIHFCFGRHTGYGGYSDWMRGGRQIVVDEGKLGRDNVLETWTRLENGNISGRVNLNSTYGSDHYPAVTKLKTSQALAPEQPEAEAASSKTSTITTDNDEQA